MTILDTFVFNIKMNTENLKKGAAEVDKTTKGLQTGFKGLKDESIASGEAFLGLARAAGGAVASYMTLGAVRSNIARNIDFNASVERTSNILQKNSAALGNVSKMWVDAGGSAETFLGIYNRIAQQAASRGLEAPEPLVALVRMRKELAGLSGNPAKLNRLAQWGVSDDVTKSILLENGSQFDKRVSRAMARDNMPTPEALEFKEALGSLRNEMDESSKAISRRLLPAVTGLIDGITRAVHSYNARDNDAEKAGVVGGSLYAIKSAVSAIRAGSLSRLIASPARGGIVGAGVASGVMLGGFVREDLLGDDPLSSTNSMLSRTAHGIGRRLAERVYGVRMRYGATNPSAKDGFSSGGGKALTHAERMRNRDMIVSYFLSKGATPEMAAVMAGQAKGESGFDPNAFGDMDKGGAHGFFQWNFAPANRARINRAIYRFGIDPRTATPEQQLELAYKELQASGLWSKYAQSKDMASIARGITIGFENPANAEIEWRKRLNFSQEIMRTASPFLSGAAGGAVSVNIGKIDVNTQATDAQGVASALHHEINQVFTQNADGRSK